MNVVLCVKLERGRDSVASRVKLEVLRSSGNPTALLNDGHLFKPFLSDYAPTNAISGCDCRRSDKERISGVWHLRPHCRIAFWFEVSGGRLQVSLKPPDLRRPRVLSLRLIRAHLRPKSQPWRDCAPFAPQKPAMARLRPICTPRGGICIPRWGATVVAAARGASPSHALR